jgi:hypothetical protein
MQWPSLETPLWMLVWLPVPDLLQLWTGRESWLAAAIVASAEHGGKAHSQVVTPTSARSTVSNGGYMSLGAIVKQ